MRLKRLANGRIVIDKLNVDGQRLLGVIRQLRQSLLTKAATVRGIYIVTGAIVVHHLRSCWVVA